MANFEMMSLKYINFICLINVFFLQIKILVHKAVYGLSDISSQLSIHIFAKVIY